MSTDGLVGGRYRLERLLGDGGMASVHLARDEELDRPVAVKILRAGLASDETFRERFLREARLAGSLSHPNVVQVFDAGRDEAGQPYIVMECVEGETLAAELAGVRGAICGIAGQALHDDVLDGSRHVGRKLP